MPVVADSRPRSGLQRLTLLLTATILVLLAVTLVSRRVGFRWRSLPTQFSAVSWPQIVLAVAIIYLCYTLRARRWSVLLAPLTPPGTSPPTMAQLLPAQVIGFTAVALFGRVADLVRPCMIARRTGSTVTTQLAVYSVERAFDLGAAATIFSAALAFAPSTQPHHDIFVKAGAVSLAGTALLVAIAVALRVRGHRIANLVRTLLRPLPNLAELAAARILDLRQGFRAVSTRAEFVTAASLSLLMWFGIATCYWLTATAFRSTPQLAALTFPATMLVLASGIGGAVIQLPVLGWFTQIAIFAGTLHAFFAVPLETATACAALLFAVTNLSILPVGLIMAHLQGTGIRTVVSTAAHNAEPPL